MSDSSVIKVLETERACVVRAMNNECSRDCSKCDLVMDAEEIVAAYDKAISIVRTHETRLKSDLVKVGKHLDIAGAALAIDK